MGCIPKIYLWLLLAVPVFEGATEGLRCPLTQFVLPLNLHVGVKVTAKVVSHKIVVQDVVQLFHSPFIPFLLNPQFLLIMFSYEFCKLVREMLGVQVAMSIFEVHILACQR